MLMRVSSILRMSVCVVWTCCHFCFFFAVTAGNLTITGTDGGTVHKGNLHLQETANEVRVRAVNAAKPETDARTLSWWLLVLLTASATTIVRTETHFNQIDGSVCVACGAMFDSF